MPRSDPPPPFDLPVFLNSFNLHALVVGGGPVGRRKAATLLETRAFVRVVALEPRPAEMPDHRRLEWLAEPYRPEHLGRAKLVFTAAPRDVCERVQADARARGVLVCRADHARGGDFITPTVVRRGNQLRIAISTGGASPTLARRIAGRLAKMFDESFDEWVDVLGRWRLLAEMGRWESARGRRRFLSEISKLSWLAYLRSGGLEKLVDAYLALAIQYGYEGPDD
ncbi:MAG TPA: bifunctional precorrin-2 dehydrogenase/sirohydrochlorin ferrochelatase [Gemmataceae bacterium]|jgi:precorrin-2 dehydrogenase/sirohydrochlorin ferrochelatase